jgi:hypothetical protein
MATPRIIKDVDPFISDDTAATRKKDIEDWNRCIKHNMRRLFALTKIGYRCGSTLDNECCAPIPDDKMAAIMNEYIVPRILSGEMKVNGDIENWSNGCFGSRWADFKARPHGLDYIRVAFYSKKCDVPPGKTWKFDKPYYIVVQFEKAR